MTNSPRAAQPYQPDSIPAPRSQPTGAQPAAALARFSTRMYQPNLRFPAWLDIMRRFFGDVRAEASAQSGFEGWVHSLYEHDVVVSRMFAGAQCIEHRKSSAQALQSGFLHVIFPLSGYFHIDQGGNSVVIEPGEWGVYDLSRDFRSLTRRPVELLVLAAPREKILAADFDDQRIIARRFSCREGGARVVKNLLATLFEEQQRLTPLLRHSFAMSALQGTRLNLMELAASGPSNATRQLLRIKVETYVANNLRNSDLSIDAIAHSCGCSRRYIHKLFSTVGKTAGQYIMEARLAGCAKDLASRECDHLSITEVAVSWGFNSSSNFSRAFRQHFAVSPRAYRAARRESYISNTMRALLDLEQQGRN